jgi:coenzyme PQQ precursor peptide PqqA
LGARSTSLHRQGDDGGKRTADLRSFKMAWKTPKIVEVPAGMEINMYACAAYK